MIIIYLPDIPLLNPLLYGSSILPIAQGFTRQQLRNIMRRAMHQELSCNAANMLKLWQLSKPTTRPFMLQTASNR
ncbi:hypothetical protein SPRA44_490007 [Serratia proteamaculans]|nr:hypothetical protein SPRA44_490007 [Serratia proteamaculans]